MIKAMWSSSVVLVLCASTLAACGVAVESDEFTEAAFEEESIGETQQALFRLCENARIEVKNLREEANGARPDIKVTALSFYDSHRDKWNKQSVSNRIINYNDDYPYTEDLENADGHTITRWRVYYKYDLGNGWSSERNQEINTVDEVCEDGLTVDLTVTD
jgi:hypothetical protein